MLKRYKLDQEEQEILDAIEQGRWETVKPSKKELNHYAQIAKATLRKSERVNIRISGSDLDEIKGKAVREGMPYQTLITSVLHKYVSGKLKSA